MPPLAIAKPELLIPYYDAEVGNFLVAPAKEGMGAPPINVMRSLEDIRVRSGVQLSDEQTGMMVTDKTHPHAVREAMWMHGEDEPIATVGEYFAKDPDLSRSLTLFQQMAGSAVAAEEDGSYVTLAWSNDPLTLHRASIQGEKRLHFHLTSRHGELEEIPSVTTRIGDLDIVDRSRIAEEYSYAASAYLRDYIDSRPDSPFELENLHPCVISLKIGDWSDLATPEGVQKVASFIDLLETQHSQIASSFGGEDNEGFFYMNDTRNPIEVIRDVSGLDETRLGLVLLADFVQGLKNGRLGFGNMIGSGRDVDLAKLRKHYRTLVTPSKGFAYAAGFSKHDGTLSLNIRPSKFSDLGGAGCAIIEGIPVRVKKGSIPMTPTQTRQRQAFMRQVVDIAAVGA